MSNSTSTLRWLIVAVATAAVLLLRIFRGEALHGLNPMLLPVLLLALYMLYRLARRT